MNLTQAEYILALSVIRRTLLDALDGHGMETLAALFYPMPQTAIAVMLDADPETALARTLTVCQRLLSLDDDARQALRHCLRWSSFTQIEQVMSDACG